MSLYGMNVAQGSRQSRLASPDMKRYHDEWVSDLPSTMLQGSQMIKRKASKSLLREEQGVSKICAADNLSLSSSEEGYFSIEHRSRAASIEDFIGD
jgi:hypothetical protein